MANRYRYKGKEYSKEELLKIFKEILRATLNATKIAAIDWTNRFVPKRTSALRNSLIDWINKHWVTTDKGLKASLDTNIEYAFNISGDAAHKGTWFEHSGSPAYAYYNELVQGRVYLDDPQALTLWSGMMASFLNSEFNKNIITYKENLLGG